MTRPPTTTPLTTRPPTNRRLTTGRPTTRRPTTGRPTTGRPRTRRGDSGALTPMVVVFVTAIFMMVGLAVDGGGRMRAVEHADNVAAEAARAGGQALNLPQAVTGQADVIDPAAAAKAAQAYLADAGVTGNVAVGANGKTITVTVFIPYQPVFLGIIGLGPWTEKGTATAQLLTG